MRVIEYGPDIFKVFLCCALFLAMGAPAWSEEPTMDYFALQGNCADAGLSNGAAHIDQSVSTYSCYGTSSSALTFSFSDGSGESCLYIDNHDEADQHTFFVPLNSSGEWAAFKSSTQSGALKEKVELTYGCTEATVPNMCGSSVSLPASRDGTSLTYKTSEADKTETYRCSATSGCGTWLRTGDKGVCEYTDGVCGASSGSSFSSAPTSDLCSSGSASAISGFGPWSWTCDSPDGGTNATCTASKADECNSPRSLVFLQDLTGSYWDDIDNLRSAMNTFLNDPSFATSKVALTSFLDYTDAYLFKKWTDLVPVGANVSMLNSVLASYVAYGGWDEPESQYIAIKSAIETFVPSATQPLTLVLVTDAHAHASDNAYSASDPAGTYPSEAEIGALIESTDTRLVVLASPNTWAPDLVGFYQGFIARYGIKGEVVTMSTDSSNFLSALKTGLAQVCK